MAAPAGADTLVKQEYLKSGVPLGDAITAGKVPGLGPKSVDHLVSKDGFAMKTWAHFFGYYFLYNRHSADFITYLTTKAAKSDCNLRNTELAVTLPAVEQRFANNSRLSQVDTVGVAPATKTDTQSSTEVRFSGEKLPKGALTEELVPQLGTATIEKLVKVHVKTFDQLFAQWFLNGCTEAGLLKWLEGAAGVGRQQAGPMAAAIHHKMSGIKW